MMTSNAVLKKPTVLEMKIIIVTFDFGTSTTYKTLHDVLIYSIEKHMPDAKWVSITLDEPELHNRVKGFITNTVKLYQWVKEIQSCKDGENVLLLDCDMLVIGDLKEIFKKEFDVAYTVRANSKYPVNGGAIYVKVNERSRKFFDRFYEINKKMLDNPEFHQEWRNKYAGMNQAAFGYLLEKEKDIANLVPIPCRKWNVCQENWKDYDEDARLIHVKGQLRYSIFNRTDCLPELQRAVELWRTYFHEYQNSKK